MESTELVQVATLNPIAVFTGPDGVERILQEIEGKVAEFAPDISTNKGRKEVASMAYKVSQSKVVLDTLGKDLVADWKAKSKQVDESRKLVRDRLDALRDEVRRPLTEWEEAEAARIAAEKLAKEIEQAHEEALVEHAMRKKMEELAAREAELLRQEEERKAKEEAERLEKERQEAEKRREEEEARRIKEAEERAKREAEEEAKRKIFEAERREAEAQAAKERAEQERLAAIERAKEDQARAVREAEERARAEAERKERERLDREAAERAEAERKAADKEHRRKINVEVLEDLMDDGVDEATAKQIIRLVYSGNVRHMKILY